MARRRMSRRRRTSGLQKFFKNVGEAVGVAEKTETPVPGIQTRAFGGIERAKGLVGNETARMVFGVVGYLGNNITSGVVQSQGLLDNYPIVQLGVAVGLTYVIGMLVAQKADYRKAILLGALINAALQIAKRYGGLAAENTALRGQVASFEQNQQQYDNVTDFNSQIG